MIAMITAQQYNFKWEAFTQQQIWMDSHFLLFVVLAQLMTLILNSMQSYLKCLQKVGLLISEEISSP